MTIIVKNVGENWTVEIDGNLIGQASSQSNAEALIASWRKRDQWVSSWRFCDK